MDRRTTLKWVLAVGASVPALMAHATPSSRTPAPGAGYGPDPDLTPSYPKRHLWPLLLSDAEKRTARVLCDLIIPADDISPSASEVGVVEFLDEWLSAPYPTQLKDRQVVRDGFAWLNSHSRQRFKHDFADLNLSQHVDICDAICDVAKAAPDLETAAEFFARLRLLIAGGFYSTPVGRRDLGYIGNVALTSFEGPPEELLQQLGLAQS